MTVIYAGTRVQVCTSKCSKKKHGIRKREDPVRVIVDVENNRSRTWEVVRIQAI